MRTFSLVEGTSDKFWSIDVVDASVTVNYGRTGTRGQTKTTQYESAEKARVEADKLIASKVRKGYTEGEASGGLTPVAPTVKTDRPAPKPVAATSASAGPAPEAAAAAAEPDWATDELVIVTTAIERALLAGEPFDATPLSDAELAVAADPAARRAWLREHAYNESIYGNTLDFDAQPFDGVPTAAVARWWLRFGEGADAPLEGSWRRRIPPVRERLAYADAGGDPDSIEHGAAYFNLPPETTVTAVYALAGPQATARLTSSRDDLGLMAMRALVLPHLAPEERVLTVHQRHQDKDVDTTTPAWELTRAAAFGTVEEVRAALAAAFAAGEVGARPAVAAAAALTDPEERWSWLQRARLRDDPHLVRPWLVFAGARGIPAVLESLQAEFISKGEAVAQARALAGAIDGPGALPAILTLAADPRVASVAAAWLASHPRALAAATSPVPSAQRDLLRGIIREVRATSPDAFGTDIANPFVTAVLADLAAEDAVPAVSAGQAPQWWATAVAAEAEQPIATGSTKIPAKVPAWATPSALPPLLVDGVRLDADLTAAVLASALTSANEPELTPRPLVAAVRARMLGKDRDALATPLLRSYLANGAKTGDRAWFLASGYLGADGFVQTLGPLVREWPGQAQHARAVLGLDVLAATGTDGALQTISGIANKSKFKGVQKAAQESLAKLAALRGLSVEQLEDRVVPDANLDERGTRTFSYGPRSFRVSLSPQGKAVIRDLDEAGRPVGKPRTALPAPRSADDAELAAAAKADFTVLRKQLTEVAKIQTARLEKALVTGRTWTAQEHRELLAQHPVLNSLIRPLVWQVSVAGAPAALVRVTEDHDYVTVAEDAYEPAEDAELTLAHPLTLEEATKDAWRAHLVDYDLIAPLEQLDRATFGLPAGQDGVRLAEVPTGAVNPGSFVSTLERLGWRRGNPADAGVVAFMWLPCETQGLAAVMSLAEGLYTGMLLESPDVQIQEMLLGPIDAVRDAWYLSSVDGGWLPWADADPVLISEVRRSLDALAEKMV